MRFPLMNKAVALGGVVLGLVWALGSVQGVVRERQGRQAEAAQGVADSLAGAQTLLGPMLLRHCTETWTAEQGEGRERKTVAEQRQWTQAAAPASLQITAGAAMEPRYRGLFKVNAYMAQATLQAQWADLQALVPRPSRQDSSVSCEDPILSVAVGDARGIRSVRLSLQGKALEAASGPAYASYRDGFHARVPAALIEAGGPVRANLALELAGTQGLGFAPVGGTSAVTLRSSWPHPSFNGRFLPVERQVDQDGFTAAWRLSALATTAQQAYLQGAPVCAVGADPLPDVAAAREAYEQPAPRAKADSCIETFSVDFMDPVNPYVLSDRATKYGLLFIALTFLGVIMVELLRSLRVHPVQYLLVGSALTVFFLLLVSLSEHLPFGAAYACASLACTGLLAFYGSHVLGGWRSGLVFGGAVGALYGTLYLLLQLEQTSLVLGSILLFVVLAAVMTATRRVDWYALMARMRAVAEDPASAGASSSQGLGDVPANVPAASPSQA